MADVQPAEKWPAGWRPADMDNAQKQFFLIFFAIKQLKRLINLKFQNNWLDVNRLAGWPAVVGFKTQFLNFLDKY